MTGRTVVFVALIAAPGCSGTPSAPSETTGATVAGTSGASSVTMTAISPAAGESIDAARWARVTVQYVLGSTAQDPRVWTCLGQTPTSVILSSCRDTRVKSSSGTVENRPDVFYINGRRVVEETRFIASFFAEGDIVERRVSVPPFELAYDKLTRRILARETKEHVFRWGDMR